MIAVSRRYFCYGSLLLVSGVGFGSLSFGFGVGFGDVSPYVCTDCFKFHLAGQSTLRTFCIMPICNLSYFPFWF